MILDDNVTVKELDLVGNDVDKLTVAIALIMMPNGKPTMRMPSRDGDRGNGRYVVVKDFVYFRIKLIVFFSFISF